MFVYLQVELHSILLKFFWLFSFLWSHLLKNSSLVVQFFSDWWSWFSFTGWTSNFEEPWDPSTNLWDGLEKILVKYCIKFVRLLVCDLLENLAYRLCLSQWLRSRGCGYIFWPSRWFPFHESPVSYHPWSLLCSCFSLNSFRQPLDLL